MVEALFHSNLREEVEHYMQRMQRLQKNCYIRMPMRKMPNALKKRILQAFKEGKACRKIAEELNMREYRVSAVLLEYRKSRL
jgi:DNA-binding NarL/FixJ family response regulator